MLAKRKFGKLIPEDIRAVFLLLPELDEQRRQLQAEIAKKPEQFVSEFLSTGFAWSHLYEYPFLQLLSGLLDICGLTDFFAKAVASDSPITVLSTLDSDESLKWDGGITGKFTKGDLLGYLYAATGALECALVYGCYLNDLVAEAKSGKPESIFRAIRIDPSVVTGPTAKALISAAVVEGNKKFIHGIYNALNGKMGKQDNKLKKFRFLMLTLHEVGALDLPTKEIMELVLEVDAYDISGEREFTAQKNIRELVLRYKSLKRNTI